MAYEQLKLGNQLCFRLYAASRLITQSYQPLLSRLGLTYAQYLVLLVLWEQDHQRVNDIAKRLLLETNTVTPLIKRMEQMKLVTRRRGKTDARQTIVSLTDHGKALEKDAAEVPSCITRSVLGRGVELETMVGMAPLLDEFIAKMRQTD